MKPLPSEEAVLPKLQASIERLHGAETALDVRQYVVDPEVWKDLPGAKAGAPEQLFVREDPADPDGLEMALYIAPEIVRALEHDDPHQRLHAGNLEEFCIALEGVSHFVFVAHRASAGRPVSALELEIQAEVDKFASSWLLLVNQGGPAPLAAKALLRVLFERYELREGLSADEADRYHLATRVAQRFCEELASTASPASGEGKLERAVQRFVRRGLEEKLRAA